MGLRTTLRSDGRLHGGTIGRMSDFRVVIAGGGIAAVEGLLRLRRLLGDSLDLRLLAPDRDLVYRPTAVQQPFAFGPPKRHSLDRIAADNGAERLRDSLASVDRDARVVGTGGGQTLAFDALLVAVGARQVPAYPQVSTFSDAEADETYQGIVQDVEGGYAQSMAFLVPEGPVYPLPIYELALMTAERAYSMGIDNFEVSVVTPEPTPLAIFGQAASEAVSRLLEDAGITVYAAAVAEVLDVGRLLIQPQGAELHPQRMVAMPRLEGPAIPGLGGGGPHGFIPIDHSCCVPGTMARIYAAGDAAAYPVKHGGLGAQMADTAASAIALLAGADVEYTEFLPTIRGKVFTGKAPLYISARLVGPKGFQSEVYDKPPWPEDDKIVAEELGPYLAQLDARPA
jgi:sulfide:quinone oxidoreductase